MDYSRQYLVGEVKTKINETLKGLSSGFTCLQVREINKKPHPFVVGSAHIKRYSMDLKAGPCCARVHPDDLTKFSVKRESKKGITDFCKVPLEEHTCERVVLLSLFPSIEEVKMIESDVMKKELDILENALKKGAVLDTAFKECHILGLNILELDSKLK